MIKPEIKLKVIDWCENSQENYFTRFLSKKYTITQSPNPDYVLCSLFDSKHRHYDCIKILFIGEDIVPDFNLYDYALGFQDIRFDDRYLRFPLPFTYEGLMESVQNKHLFLKDEDA